MYSDGLKYASRLPLGYWLHDPISSAASRCPTANPARLGQLLPPTFEAERVRSGESLDCGLG